jgi:MFS family permease
MSFAPTSPTAEPSAGRPWRLPSGVAFYLQASIVVAFLAASSAPTPLYGVYQAEWGFSPITTTVVFGIYALVVLAALLVVGSLSDHVGRRPVLLAAIALQAVGMVVLTTAGGVGDLLAARVLQGLATGAAMGAVGAGMLDLDKARGTLANAVAPTTGTATGALVSGLLVQYLPAPTHLVYLVILAVFVLQGIGVALMRETSGPKPGALASLRPRFGVPRAARGPLLVATPVLVAVWALAGLYGSVVPAVVNDLVGSTSHVLGGLALFALAGSGALTVLPLRATAPRRVMLFGTVALIAGVGVTLVAIDARSVAWFFIGTVIAGAGFGGGFQGALRTVVPLAAPHERSGLLSTIYVVSYLAMGLPAVIGGYLVVHGGGLLTTTKEYGVAVIVLALLALLGLALRRERSPQVSVVVAAGTPAATERREPAVRVEG